MGNTNEKLPINKPELHHLLEHTTYTRSEAKYLLRRFYQMSVMWERESNANISLSRDSDADSAYFYTKTVAASSSTGSESSVKLSRKLPLDYLLSHLTTRNPVAAQILDMFIVQVPNPNAKRSSKGTLMLHSAGSGHSKFVDYLELAIWMNRFNVGANVGSGSATPVEQIAGVEGSPVFSPSPLLKSSSVAHMSSGQHARLANASSSTTNASLQSTEQRYRFLFSLYDKNQDGYIDSTELALIFDAIMGDEMTEANLEQMAQKTLKEYDKDRDGKLSYEEFKVILVHQMGT